MNTQLLKRIRWLLVLPLAMPLVSHAANDAFSDQICAILPKAQCPKIPADEQGITNLMIEITKQWFQTAVAQEATTQVATTDPTSTTPTDTTPTNTTTDPTPSENPPTTTYPNPMPAPPVVSHPVAPKPPEKPVDVAIVKQPEKPVTPAIIQPTPPTPPIPVSKPIEPSLPTTKPPVEPAVPPVVDPNKDKLPTNPPAPGNPASPTKPTEPEKPIPSETVAKPTVTPTSPTSTEGDKKADLCPQTNTFAVNCVAYNQVFENITIENEVSVSQIQLRGQITNRGMISNSRLLTGGALEGGTISGEFQNFGTVQNTRFIGSVLQGGTLAGEIISKGELKNVRLAAGGHIQGESPDKPAILSGIIQGDAQQPALLEHVKIAAGTHITGVQFGADVILDPNAIVELPTFNHASQVNSKGEMLTTTAKFSGGLSRSEPMNFAKELTITSDQVVKLRFNITPEAAHNKQRAQLLFVIGKENLDKSGNCSAGTNVSYQVLLRSEQRDVDLYALPNVWVPQLVERHDEDTFWETNVVFSYDDLWQSKQLSEATCHYFFIGYRLAADSRIVFDTTPLILKVK